MGLRLAVMPGDGFGPALTTKVFIGLEAVGERLDHSFNLNEGLVGGSAVDTLGRALSYETLTIVVEYAKAGLERLIVWNSA